jgi:TetR/AcrR family transcriptional regulator, cholesterol catabolism regulator
MVEVSREGVRTAGRRDEVLEAAAKVFYRQGYAAASVQDVADELGILKGSLYHYIDSKEGLLFHLLEGTHADLRVILDEVSALERADPQERLWQYVYRQVEYNVHHLARISVYYQDVVMLNDERRQRIYRGRREHEKFVIDLITRCTGASEGDATMLAMCLFATIIWTHKWYRTDRFCPEEAARLCADFAIAGVARSMAT